MHTDTHFYGEIPSCVKQPQRAHVAWIGETVYSRNFHVGFCLHESTWNTKNEMGINMAVWKETVIMWALQVHFSCL